jgi:hypothetical protein
MLPKLTYANVVATLALFIAIGGASAFAASQLGKNTVGTKQLKNNAVSAAKIKNGAVTQAKISSAAQAALKGATGLQGPKGEAGAPATKLFAVVSADGKLIRGSGVISTSQGETKEGVYTVIFNQDVSACAFIATPAIEAGTNGDSTFPNPALATVGPLKENANGVVVVRASGEEPKEPDSGVVHVAVFC